MGLILASLSPRRHALLVAAGISHRVVAAEVDERFPPSLPPCEVASLLAARKAHAVAARGIRGRILGADTLVVLDGRILGKPADAEDARRTLTRLSGRDHEVLTGICLLDTGTGIERTRVERTVVTFRPLESAEIDIYVATGEPMDKAGGYGIQGAAGEFVAALAGPRDNVIGLPVALVRELLAEET